MVILLKINEIRKMSSEELSKKITETKEELFKYTVIVVATVIFFLAFFYALDLGIGRLIELIK